MKLLLLLAVCSGIGWGHGHGHAPEPGPRLAGDELSELKTKLRDSKKWIRKDAVEGLAKLGTPAAFELVVEALADPMGEVADSAQWVLGSALDEGTLALLFDKPGLKARDDLVRLRAAEAIGRVPVDLDADPLRKALGDKDARVRRALYASIAARAAPASGVGAIDGDRARLAGAVEKALGREKDDRARGEGLLALAALDAPRARVWWRDEVGRKPTPGVACAALRGAESLALSPGEIEALAAGGGRAARFEAVEALARARTLEATRGLVERLAREEEERLARRIAERLRELSGMKFGRDPRPWRDWAASLSGDWTPAAPADAEAVDPEASSSLAGLPILSGRVAFLIDLSGSMWKEREDGKTRKEVVDEQLRTCLMRLPEATRFNVIPFTRDPIPWKKGVVAAKPKDVKAAADWFEGLNDQGTGNFWDAFLLALEDPEVDTVVMLGDGEPTGGARYRLELLPDLLHHENLGRAVTVDSILVDAKARKTRTAWDEIARLTGGMSIRVEL